MGKILLSIFFLALSACVNGGSDDNNSSSSKEQNIPATIRFVNTSGYNVDIYRNRTPPSFDPEHIICSVAIGKTVEKEVYASEDNLVGDAFYMHYKVLLADKFETGTDDIFIYAQRNASELSSISFVVEAGETYTKTIPPPEGDLKFMNGYIEVQNNGDTPIRIMRGSTILSKLNNKEDMYLDIGKMGYYEITFTQFDQVISMNQGVLKANSGNTYKDFPQFTVERGKLYKFTVGESVSEPSVSNINF